MGDDSALGSAFEKTILDQKWFMDFFDGIAFFADGNGEGADADGAAVVGFGDGGEKAFVHLIEPVLVDLEKLESGSCEVAGDVSITTFFGVVADEIH